MINRFFAWIKSFFVKSDPTIDHAARILNHKSVPSHNPSVNTQKIKSRYPGHFSRDTQSAVPYPIILAEQNNMFERHPRLDIIPTETSVPHSTGVSVNEYSSQSDRSSDGSSSDSGSYSSGGSSE